MERLIFEELFGDEMMISSPVVWSDEMQQLSSEYSAADNGVFPTHFNLPGVGCHQSFDGLKKVNAFDLNPSCESSSLVLPASTGSASDSGDSSTATTTAYLNQFHEVSRFLDEDDDELPTATTHQFQSFKDYTHGGEELPQFPTTHNDGLEGGILAILSHCKSTDSTSSSAISGGSTESYPNIPFQSSKERRTTLTSTGTSPKRKQIGPFDVKSEAPPPQNKKPRRPSKMDFETQDFITYEPNKEAITQMKEMIYRAAVMRPVNLGPEKPTEKPKRKNVRISNDPQTVAARHRRERIGDRLRVLQRLVPGGNKMDTASMLDEACNYLKYLKSQLGSMDNLKRRVESNPNFSFSSKYA